MTGARSQLTPQAIVAWNSCTLFICLPSARCLLASSRGSRLQDSLRHCTGCLLSLVWWLRPDSVTNTSGIFGNLTVFNTGSAYMTKCTSRLMRDALLNVIVT